MKPRLLDINVLIAMAWPSHVHHAQAQDWFARNRSAGFRTCPLTQAGFVRISSNPSFTSHAVSPRTALVLLDRITELPEHGFWPDDLPLNQAILPEQQLVGHRQITDAYLIALAAAHGGAVATLDRAMLAVASGSERLVELVL
ncbi:MAG: TA system VapC family ribonuclease toxin [Bryobacteraceae bacterium]